jgi:2',3'-cyclic-nucleotide 2'-phosphodiesterase (5'-nucleotidase family)
MTGYRQAAMLVVALAGVSILSGCGSSRVVRTGTPGEAVSFVVITDSLPPDPDMDALVAPFSEVLVEKTSEVVGFAKGEIRKGRPEGPLGTFAAEGLLSQVQSHVNRPVDMALTNNGGLRVPLGPGPITLGKMIELMPFENTVVILDMSAGQVDSLAQQLARGGGDPIAGFSLVIDPLGQARDVRVAGQPLDPNRIYRLATSDYLANGGGSYSVLWGLPREELPYLLRDAFTEHLRVIGTIEPIVHGLIRQQQ